MSSVFLKLYFDTTCWVRIVENPSKTFLKKEKEAILDIFHIIEQNPERYKVFSSKTQLDQLYIKRNRITTSAQERNALNYVITQIQIKSGDTYLNDPHQSVFVRNLILQNTLLPDREDAKQIGIAWIQGANYFVTVDWKTILNMNKNKMIESALKSLQHPISLKAGRYVEIIDPVSLIQELSPR